MNWKRFPAARISTALLPAVLFGTLLIVSGCSSSRPDPSSRNKPTPESADMMAMRRDNESLRQDQLNSQRQIEALTKQLVADREEQRRFREMMSTNFDLLEQSVSRTLSTSIDKGPSSPTPTPVAAPAPLMDEPPRMTSGVAAGMTSSPKVGAQGSYGAQNGYTPLVVPGASKSDMRMAGMDSKAAPMLNAPAARSNGMSANGSSMNSSANKSGMPLAAAVVVPSSKAGVAPVVQNGKPYSDPDLSDPANPKNLTANRAAKPLYEKGFVLFGNRQYEQSILVYQNFLSRYPEDIYSDNAQFWIGESYMRMDKLEDAEAAYRKVLREYAHKSTLEGYKTPDAIYRIGQIYAKRNNDKLARYYLTQVAQRFPDSSAGRKAVRDLESNGPLTSLISGDFVTGG